VGAVLAESLVSAPIEELYDYDVVRRLENPTALIVHLARPTIVLGGNQDASVLRDDVLAEWPVRRRRGGGGVVLLQPDDLWIDWWIPASDDRWQGDVRVAAVQTGDWWRDALEAGGVTNLTTHHDGVEGDPSWRVVCFAGRGPGEVFQGERKVVGLTQWRVREGTFLSTVVHAQPSTGVVDLLAAPPAGLREALDHVTVGELGLSDPDHLLANLADSLRWQRRVLYLDA
jgi:lipoate-protein ligase A